MHIIAHVADYIYDNCDDARLVEFGWYCYRMISADFYWELTPLCSNLGGQLAWFDSTQEYEEVIRETVAQFQDTDRNQYFYTGDF